MASYYASPAKSAVETFSTIFGNVLQAKQLQQQKQYQDATIGLQKDKLGLEQRKLDLEMAPLHEMQGLEAVESAQLSDRNAATQTLSQLMQVARLPKSMRDVDTLAQAFQQNTGITLAPNVVKALKTASTEELMPILKEGASALIDRPELGMSSLKPALQSPMAFTALVGKLNDSALAKQKEQEVMGPPEEKAPDPHAELKAAVTKLEQERDRNLAVAGRYPTTKAAAFYAARADHIQQRIDKMTGRYDVKPTNQMTQTHLSVRISGKQTGNPYIDAMTPAEAKDSLDRLQKGEVLPFVDEDGNVIGRYTPRSDLAGKPILDKHLNERTAKLGKTVADSRVASIYPALKILDKAVDAYDSGAEIPGIGYAKNMPIATFVKTPLGKHIAAARQLLQNEEMKQISGGAVTDPEAIRNEIARAMTKAHSAEDWIRVYKEMIRPMYNAIFRNVIAEAGPDAVDVYRKRSRGFDLNTLVNDKYDAVWGNEPTPATPKKQGGGASLPEGFVEIP